MPVQTVWQIFHDAGNVQYRLQSGHFGIFSKVSAANFQSTIHKFVVLPYEMSYEKKVKKQINIYIQFVVNEKNISSEWYPEA